MALDSTFTALYCFLSLKMHPLQAFLFKSFTLLGEKVGDFDGLCVNQSKKITIFVTAKKMYFKNLLYLLVAMASFIGEFSCKLDDKGRVPFPAAFRAAAVDANGQILLMLRRHTKSSCLVITTKAEWEHELLFLNQNLDPYDEKSEGLRRKFFKNIAELEVDNSGRILLPKALCETANIKKNVVFLGQATLIEIWDSDKYAGLHTDNEDDEALASILSKSWTARHGKTDK
jgi:MraZ protein